MKRRDLWIDVINECPFKVKLIVKIELIYYVHNPYLHTFRDESEYFIHQDLIIKKKQIKFFLLTIY